MAGMLTATDEQQLEFASADARVIVTANRRDFGRLARDWGRISRDHARIVMLADQDIDPEKLSAKLFALNSNRTAADMMNAVLYINADPDQPLW
jgi:predicted nuclease of predicted toxin-antitoxin system